MTTVEVKTTCPRDCYDACGVVVRVDDGRITRVKGDPDHPVSRGTLCAKCAVAYNSVWLDPSARVVEPLERIGSKGSGQFKEVGWDRAMEVVIDRLGGLVAAGRPETIVHTHYTGTCSLLAGVVPGRLFSAIGATEVDPDTVCNNAGHAMLDLMLGDSLTGFDPRSAAEAGCLVIWGANPSAAAPHAHKHWIPEFDGTTIVVDPVRHGTARRADIHLQPRPGTDNALAFALLAAVRDAGRIENDFLRSRCVGWDQVEAVLADCSVDVLSERCGVSADLVRQVAEVVTTTPTLLWLGQGLQRQRRGGEVFRSCVTLAAATGNMVGPGRGVLYMNGPEGRGLDLGPLDGPESPAPKVSHMDLVEVLADSNRARALVCWNNNIAASNPRQKALRAALTREDLFTVVLEVFPTDTADYADIVLPAASFLEFDDIVASYFDYSISAQVKAAAPPGSALPNQDIARRIGSAMGVRDAVLERSDRDLLDGMLASAGITFEELRSVGTVPVGGDGPVLPFVDGFPTDSGKLELAGPRFVARGLAAAPGPDVDEPPPPGWLRLLSPADTWTMNSSYSNVGQIRRRLGPLEVRAHPSELAARGLDDGQPVVMRSSVGEIRALVRTSDDVAPGVALCPKGRWPKLDPSGGNVNVVTEATRTDIGESSAVHSVHVTIEAEPESSRPQAVLATAEMTSPSVDSGNGHQ